MALHIAASEGNFDIAKFLVAQGNVIPIADNRGMIPDDDADKFHHLLVHDFLDGVVTDSIIKKNCDTFADGLLEDGLAKAIGVFHKKYMDLFLQVTEAPDFSAQLDLLRGANYIDE